MAGSRLEKIGTIYTRTAGLIKSKALNWEDRPLWYDIYEAFPPEDEPRFDRPASNIPLKSIFYEEDKIRAQFHRRNKNIGAVNMLESKNYKSLTRRFIDTYRTVATQYDGDASDDQIYKEAIDMLKRQNTNRETEETSSLSSDFQEAQKNDDNKPSVDIKGIFKE